jgi:GTP-binding protein HflX
MLVEAFRATLEQVQYADIILHVRDIASPDHPWQKQDVMTVLSDLGIEYETDARIYEVWNKIDACEPERLDDIKRHANFSDDKIFAVSAVTGEGIDNLLKQVGGHLASAHKILSYIIPYNDGKALAWLHQEGEVVESAASDAGDGLHIKVRLSNDNQGRFEARFNYHDV